MNKKLLALAISIATSSAAVAAGDFGLNVQNLLRAQSFQLLGVFSDVGTLHLQLDNLIQGSLSFLTFGNIETNVSATAVNANANANVPEPAVVWLLGFGLIALVAKCTLKTDGKPIRLIRPSPSFERFNRLG